MTTPPKILTLITCLLMTAQVNAGSELVTLVKMLHKNGMVSDDQYGRLMDEIKQGAANAAVEEQAKQTKIDNENPIELKIDEGGIQMKTADGAFATKIGGRVQIDGAWYNSDGTDLANGTEIRRARLYLQGKMFHDWGYKLQYDFINTGRSGVKDAYLTYNGFDDLELKVGNFKDPFMLQEQTSSKYITFSERSLLDAFTEGRHIGIMASSKHKHWTVATGFFGDAVDSSAIVGRDDGWGVTGRTTFSPINEKTEVIHLAAAASYRKIEDFGRVRFKQAPETHNSSFYHIVDTGLQITDADNYLKLGAELATVYGPFSMQSEYIWTTVERNAATNLDFDGWYAEAAYFITGESRRYKKGKFGGIKPNSVVGKNGIGAWQVAARYSTIDLNDHDIDGGQADSFALGVNWFPTSTLRFTANYVNVVNITGGNHDGEEPSLVQVRGQWAF